MATVMIGCKLPNDLLIEYGGKSAKINGSQSEDGMVMFEKGEYIGITYDVDKELWDKWREVNKNHPLVSGREPYKEAFIFETKSENSAKSQAKELKEVKTGLEKKTPEELTKVAGAGKLKETD